MNAEAISNRRKKAAIDYCRSVGLRDLKIMSMIDRMCDAIERRKPEEAVDHAMVYLDLAGSYRLLAIISNGSGENG